MEISKILKILLFILELLFHYSNLISDILFSYKVYDYAIN